MAIVIVGAMGCVVRSYPTAMRNQRDFQTLYAGAFCVLHHCDPYDIGALDRVLKAQGSEVSGSWMDNLPIYPPTTLAALTPLAALPYRVASRIWFALNAFGYIAALVWLLFVSDVVREVSLRARSVTAFFLFIFPKAIWILGIGNPALSVTSILIFVIFDTRSSPAQQDGLLLRQSVRVVLMAIACVLKPPMALPFLVLLCFRGRHARWNAAAVVLLLAMFSGLVLWQASAHPQTVGWERSLAANLELAQQPGQSMDPLQRNAGNPLLNLQFLLGFAFTSLRGTEVFSFAICAALAGALFSGFWKPRLTMSRNSGFYLLAAAALSAIALLPIYHRFYDAVLLILVVPWLLRSLSETRLRWPACGVLALMAILFMSWARRLRAPQGEGAIAELARFFYYRNEALAVFLVAIILVGCSIYTSRPQRHREIVVS